MKILIPTRLEIECVFECPKCKGETWMSVKQCNEYKKLVCDCGYISKLSHVNVNINYKKNNHKNSDNKTRKKNKGDDNNDNFNEDIFISTLSNLGYRKGAAKNIVENMRGEYDGDDEKFIQKIIERM